MEYKIETIFKTVEMFELEITEIKEKTNHILTYKDKKMNATLFLQMLKENMKIREKLHYVVLYGNLGYYKDIHNEEIIQRKKYVDHLQSDIESTLTFVEKKIVNLGKEKIEEYAKEVDLSIFKQYIDNLFRLQTHFIREHDQEENKELIDTIARSLEEYNTLLHQIHFGKLEIEEEQIELDFTNYARYLSDTREDVRAKTYHLVHSALSKEKERFASILNTIYQCRVQMSHLKGFSSVLEQNLFEENINSTLFTSVLKEVHNHIPCMQSYLQWRLKNVQIQNPHIWDLNVPISNYTPEYTLEEALQVSKKVFSTFGPTYKETFLKLIEDHHVETLLNEKKHQMITFSWDSYAFMNFHGKFIDLKNLVHEGGHIVGAYLSKKQPYLYEDSTVFVGELASLSNELSLLTILFKEASTNEEKKFFLGKQVDNYFIHVYKETLITEFEQILYTEVQSGGVLTSTFIEDTYQILLKKYYGNEVIYDGLERNGWILCGHIFRHAYYVYQYVTGYLMATINIKQMQENKVTNEEYISFLSSGSNTYSLDLLKKIKIDLSDEKQLQESFDWFDENVKVLKRM